MTDLSVDPLKRFAKDVVPQCPGVLLAREDTANLALSALGCVPTTDSLLADVVALFGADAVPRVLGRAACKGPDLLHEGGRAVVDNKVRAEGGEVVKVAGTRRGDDLEPRGFGKLDTDGPGGGAAAVDEDGKGFRGRLGREGELEQPVNSLSL